MIVWRLCEHLNWRSTQKGVNIFVDAPFFPHSFTFSTLDPKLCGEFLIDCADLTRCVWRLFVLSSYSSHIIAWIQLKLICILLYITCYHRLVCYVKCCLYVEKKSPFLGMRHRDGFSHFYSLLCQYIYKKMFLYWSGCSLHKWELSIKRKWNFGWN